MHFYSTHVLEISDFVCVGHTKNTFHHNFLYKYANNFQRLRSMVKQLAQLEQDEQTLKIIPEEFHGINKRCRCNGASNKVSRECEHMINIFAINV